eukprot:6979856-Pyramimonas_sp.AAC.1
MFQAHRAAGARPRARPQEVLLPASDKHTHGATLTRWMPRERGLVRRTFAASIGGARDVGRAQRRRGQCERAHAGIGVRIGDSKLL